MSDRCRRCNTFQMSFWFPCLSFPHRVLYFSIAREWRCEVNLDSAFLLTLFHLWFISKSWWLFLKMDPESDRFSFPSFLPLWSKSKSLARMMEIATKGFFCCLSYLFPALPLVYSPYSSQRALVNPWVRSHSFSAYNTP